MTERNKRINQMTIKEWERAFPNEDACCAYLIRHRWPTGVRCPRCGNPNPKRHGTMLWNWLCNECGEPTNYRFSHITGTIFENTNTPLRDWFRVIHRMLVSKKGVSALQIYRELGFGSYKTAWHMCMRIRGALANKDFRKLMGIVEVDETYVGGSDSNRHWDKRSGRRGAKGKTPVVGAVQRKGNVIARVIDRVTAPVLQGFVKEVVSDKVSLLATTTTTPISDCRATFRISPLNMHKGSTWSARSTPTRLKASGR